MAKAFGFGQPTGIGVVAEGSGHHAHAVAYHDRVTPGGYNKGFALNSAIGQGDDNVTPLQLAMAYAAIANGGNALRPQLVRRLESADGKTLQEFQPSVVRHVEISPENRRVIMEALTAVVNEPGGTAYASRLPDIKFAGKTGTAQVAALGKVRLKADRLNYWVRDHAWFASFAPVEEPEIAVVVLNEHSGFGATGAAPTASAIIKKYFELKKEDVAPPPAPVAIPEPEVGSPPPELSPVKTVAPVNPQGASPEPTKSMAASSAEESR